VLIDGIKGSVDDFARTNVSVHCLIRNATSDAERFQTVVELYRLLVFLPAFRGTIGSAIHIIRILIFFVHKNMNAVKISNVNYLSFFIST